jgi:KUP system potassium uptake protein
MASANQGMPPVLEHHVVRIRVLHEKIILLTVIFEHVPWVSEAKRLEHEKLEKGFARVIVRCGYMEQPNVPELLRTARAKFNLEIDLDTATYYLGRETFLATSAGKMGAISESIFAFLSRNSKSATSYFAIPPEQVVELGTQIDL